MRQKLYSLLNKDHPAKVLAAKGKIQIKKEKEKKKKESNEEEKKGGKVAELEKQIKDLQAAMEKEKEKEKEKKNDKKEEKKPMKAAKTPMKAAAAAKFMTTPVKKARHQ